MQPTGAIRYSLASRGSAQIASPIDESIVAAGRLGVSTQFQRQYPVSETLGVEDDAKSCIPGIGWHDVALRSSSRSELLELYFRGGHDMIDLFMAPPVIDMLLATSERWLR